jgi:hypothetical protein
VARGSGPEIERALEVLGGLARSQARQRSRRLGNASATAAAATEREEALIRI